MRTGCAGGYGEVVVWEVVWSRWLRACYRPVRHHQSGAPARMSRGGNSSERPRQTKAKTFPE